MWHNRVGYTATSPLTDSTTEIAATSRQCRNRKRRSRTSKRTETRAKGRTNTSTGSGAATSYGSVWDTSGLLVIVISGQTTGHGRHGTTRDTSRRSGASTERVEYPTFTTGSRIRSTGRRTNVATFDGGGSVCIGRTIIGYGIARRCRSSGSRTTSRSSRIDTSHSGTAGSRLIQIAGELSALIPQTIGGGSATST